MLLEPASQSPWLLGQIGPATRGPTVRLGTAFPVDGFYLRLRLTVVHSFDANSTVAESANLSLAKKPPLAFSFPSRVRNLITKLMYKVSQ